MRAIKILLTRGAEFGNKGNEAMAATVRNELTRRLGAVEFYSVCERSTNDARVAWNRGFYPIVPAVANSETELSRRVLRALWSLAVLGRRLDIPGLSALRPGHFDYAYYRAIVHLTETIVGRPDALIDMCGYSYRNSGTLRRALPWIDLSRRSTAPIIFMPQCWGPFEERECAPIAREIYNHASLCYTRDPQSRTYFAQAVGCSEEEVLIVPDLAFRFGGGNSTQAAAALQRSGVDWSSPNPIVGLSPSTRLYDRSPGKGTANSYVRTMARLVDEAVALGADVVLIPNETWPHGDVGMDDRYVCGLVHSQASESSRCHVLTGSVSAEDVHSVIGRLDFLVGSRFHTLVFGLSQGVPCLVLGWVHKYKGLLASFDLDEWVLQLSQQDEEEVVARFRDAWLARDTIRSSIDAHIGSILHGVDVMFDAVAESIERAPAQPS